MRTVRRKINDIDVVLMTGKHKVGSCVAAVAIHEKKSWFCSPLRLGVRNEDFFQPFLHLLPRAH